MAEHARAGRRGATMKAVVAAVTLALGLGLGAPAGADPVIDNPTEALAKLSTLTRESTSLNEAVLTAQATLDERLAQLAEVEGRQRAATERMQTAQAQLEGLQEAVDKYALANYQGLRLNRVAALLTSDSPQDVLNQMSALEIVAKDTFDSVLGYRSARATATEAGSEAEAAAVQLRGIAEQARVQHAELAGRQAELATRIDEVKRLYETLSAQERERWAGQVVPPGFDPAGYVGVGAAADVVRAALSRLGTPYVWGATGPGSFDCSGLVMWAHNQAGKRIPRTSQMQAQGGAPVSPADIQPGDVVIYYSGATHVGLYIGGGKIVHASTYGVPVKVDSVNNAPIHSIRRY